MAKRDGGSGVLRGVRRVLLYGVGLVVMLPLLRTGNVFRDLEGIDSCERQARYKGIEQSGLHYGQRYALCMFLNSGYLASRSREPVLRHLMALPATNCARVGVWKSSRKRLVYRVTLHADGRFQGEPLSDNSGRAEAGGGWWGEHEGAFVWVHDSGIVWPPDVNPIVEDSGRAFTLREVNGEKSEFVLQEQLDETCPPLPAKAAKSGKY